MWNIAAIFIGGGLGAVSRYMLSRFLLGHTFVNIPLGTFLVNVSGSLLIGFVFKLFDISVTPVILKTLVIIGFLGGYTTFSSYAFETVMLLQRHEYTSAGVNLLLHTVSGLIAVVIGMLSANALRSFLQGNFNT